MQSVNIPIGSREAMSQWYRSHAERLERALDQLRRELAGQCGRWGLRPTLKWRVKSFKSLYTKRLRKAPTQRDQTPERTMPTDLLGLRVVLPFLEDVRQCERLIESEYQVVEREQRGEHYRCHEFGYESIHYLIALPAHLVQAHHLDDRLVCEIQLRTILQDAWAEVEHELVYKSGFSPFDEPLRRKLAALNANLSLADTVFQEVRDYQRQLHQQTERRRKTFAATVWGKNSSGSSASTEATEDRAAAPPRSDTPEETAATVPFGITIDNLLLRALHAHNRGDFETAVALYGQMLGAADRKNLHAVIYVHRGMAHVARGDYPSALADFSKAIALEPSNPKGYFHRALVHQLEQRFSEALEDLQHCLALDPAHSEALLGRSRLYFDQGRYEAAMRDCDEALAIEPDWQQAHAWRAQIVRAMRL